MLKGLIITLCATAALFSGATPVLAAPAKNKPPAQEIKKEKVKKADVRAARKTSENAYRDAIKSANEQFSLDVKATASLKGKERVSALKAARSAHTAAIKAAQQKHKAALGGLKK